MNQLIPLQSQTIDGNAVETWRYYDCAIDKFKSILENE